MLSHFSCLFMQSMMQHKPKVFWLLETVEASKIFENTKSKG